MEMRFAASCCRAWLRVRDAEAAPEVESARAAGAFGWAVWGGEPVGAPLLSGTDCGLPGWPPLALRDEALAEPWRVALADVRRFLYELGKLSRVRPRLTARGFTAALAGGRG